MTNGDRIRAMNDEELAKIITKKYGCPGTMNHVTCGTVGTCEECWINWLRKPVEEDA